MALLCDDCLRNLCGCACAHVLRILLHVTARATPRVCALLTPDLLFCPLLAVLLTAGHTTGSKDLSAHGKVWALLKGPYGRTLTLCWDEHKEARLVDVGQPKVFWTLPDSVKLWPHDMALGAAAMPLTGAGDRMLALYVAPLCADCGVLEKYVLIPKDFGAPAMQQAVQPLVLPPGQRPPLAHSGHHAHAHGQAKPKHVQIIASTSTEAQEQQEESKDASAQQQDEEQEAQADEHVVQEEAAEDAKAVTELQDPTVLAGLKQQLADIQAKISKVTGEAPADDTEAFAVFHTKAPSKDTAGGIIPGGWVGTMLVVLLSMATGVVVMAAYQRFKGHQRNQPVLVQRQQPVGNGVAYAQSCSTEDDSEAVTLSDNSRLLRR